MAFLKLKFLAVNKSILRVGGVGRGGLIKNLGVMYSFCYKKGKDEKGEVTP